MNIEKQICPENLQLIKSIETFEDEKYLSCSTKIVDVELDIFDCDIDDSGNITINTEDYSNIVLDLDTLKQLVKLINKAVKAYEKFEG